MIRSAGLVLAALLVACTTAPRGADVVPAGGDHTFTREHAPPPAAEAAAARLAASPRHGEWVMVHTGAGDSLRAWVVYPERSGPAPVVLVIHEIYGVTAWIRSVADQLAADGFIAVAPDLLTGSGVPADETGDPARDAAVSAIRSLRPEEYQPRLAAVATWAMALPAAAPRYAILGFCWGGAAAFAHATTIPQLGAAIVFYGSSPPADRLQYVRAPVLGLYGGDDERVNATVPPAQEELQRLGRRFEVHTFVGAGHGFLRQQEGRDGANLAASRDAWPITIRFLRETIGP